MQQSSPNGQRKAAARGMLDQLTPAKTKKLSEHNPKLQPRFSSGLEELDRVLGGGFVPGSLVALWGEPGGGKSTLCSMVIDHLAGQGKKVLYVAGEESGEQIRLRTDRLGLANSDKVDITTEVEVGSVCAALASGYEFAVVDSIQTLRDAEAASLPGSPSLVRYASEALRRVAKDHGVTILVICQVTKEGNLAGPRQLEHMVDVVLGLEHERYERLRMLRSQKNRFGSTEEVGLFEMTGAGLAEVQDPTTVFLQESDDQHLPGSAVCPVLEGTRPMLVEVQALAEPTGYDRPAARRAQGIDRNRLDMLVAILSQHAGMTLKPGTFDLYLKISGGLRVEEPALDVAVAVAIASAITRRPVRPEVAVFGELSLKGQVRPVVGADRRVKEAAKLGWPKVIAAPKQGTTAAKYLSQVLQQALMPPTAG